MVDLRVRNLTAQLKPNGKENCFYLVSLFFFFNYCIFRMKLRTEVPANIGTQFSKIDHGEARVWFISPSEMSITSCLLSFRTREHATCLI